MLQCFQGKRIAEMNHGGNFPRTLQRIDPRLGTPCQAVRTEIRGGITKCEDDNFFEFCGTVQYSVMIASRRK